MDWEQGILPTVLFILSCNAVLIFSGVIVLWIWNVLTKMRETIDLSWGFWIFISALTAYLFSSGLRERKIALLVLAGLWGVKLTFSAFLQRQRKEHASEWRVLAEFLFQGLLMLLFSLPFVSICFNPAPLGPLDIAGFSLALIPLFLQKRPWLFWIGMALCALAGPWGFTGIFACLLALIVNIKKRPSHA